jgi:hypothetical protein
MPQDAPISFKAFRFIKLSLYLATAAVIGLPFLTVWEKMAFIEPYHHVLFRLWLGLIILNSLWICPRCGKMHALSRKFAFTIIPFTSKCLNCGLKMDGTGVDTRLHL